MPSYLIKSSFSELQVQEAELNNLGINKLPERKYHILYKNKSVVVEIISVSMDESEVELMINNQNYTYKICSELSLIIAKLGFTNKVNNQDKFIKSPMPGIVTHIEAKVGDQIHKGQNLITLEAMKMENIIKASNDGIIQSIHVNPSDKVDKNQIMISLV
ncbi:MAG: acetyl-CoA carboxylase biotin carboxyl carrier protein subunit [Saprospiraceae bacterium]